MGFSGVPKALEGQSFLHLWQLMDILERQSEAWKLLPSVTTGPHSENALHGQNAYVQQFFHTTEDTPNGLLNSAR